LIPFALVPRQWGKSIDELTPRSPRLGAGGVFYPWPARVISRRSLCDLDDHILKDIGLTRDEIAFEAYKPFWRR
jgi:hypothetical protein